MTDEVKLIVNTLRECAVATPCSKCAVFCGNDECFFTATAKAIESLSTELEQVMHERDAAVEDLKGTCTSCINYCASLLPYGCQGDMREECEKCPCTTCERGSNWQWRGAKEG